MSTTDEILGIIPVAIAGGIAMKFSETLTPKYRGRKTLRRRQSKPARPSFGDFRNVGF